MWRERFTADIVQAVVAQDAEARCAQWLLNHAQPDHSGAMSVTLHQRKRLIAAQLGIAHVQAIPLSALEGDNLLQASANTPWYPGPALLPHLETVEPGGFDAASGLRLPVQWVNRPNQDFRGFAGTIASGSVKPGDAVVVAKSGKQTTVKRIVAQGGDLRRDTKEMGFADRQPRGEGGEEGAL